MDLDSDTVQDSFSTARQSSFQNQIKAEEETTGKADSITGQLLVTYLLHTVQDPFCTATQFSFENSFHTPLFVFWWTRSWHPRSRLRERFYGWSWVQSRSAVSHPSLIHSSRSIQHSKTVQFPKQFSLSSLCFLVDQVLASQIKAEEETLWVKLTPKQVSF